MLEKIYLDKVLIFLVIVFAIFFRVWRFPDVPPGFYSDEAVNANQALEAIDKREFKLFFSHSSRESLYIYTVGASLKLFGETSIAAARLPSIIFGLLGVLGTYLLAKEILNTKIAIYSAFFMSVAFWHVVYSRSVLRGISLPVMLSFFLYFFLLGLRRGKWYFLASGVFYALGFYTYTAYQVTPLILVVIFISIYYLNKNRLAFYQNVNDTNIYSSLLIFILSSILVLLPILVYSLGNPEIAWGRSSDISVFGMDKPILEIFNNTVKTLGMFLNKGDRFWLVNIPGRPQLSGLMGFCFLLGLISLTKDLVISIKKNDWEKIFVAVILFTTLFVMIIPSILSVKNIPSSLRSIGAAVPSFIISGIGLNTIAKYSNKVKISFMGQINNAILVVIVVFAITAFTEYRAYFSNWANDPNAVEAGLEYYVEIGNFLNELPPETKKYVYANRLGPKLDGMSIYMQTVKFITNDDPEIVYIIPDNFPQQIDINHEQVVIVPLKFQKFLLKDLEEYFGVPFDLDKTAEGVGVFIR